MITPNEFKALRISKGLTQKDLAQIVGTTQTTITNIEKGITKNPSVDIAIKIANALELDIYELFGNEIINSSFSGKGTQIHKLQSLVIETIFRYEETQLSFKQFDHDQENTEDWNRFKSYELNLSEFRKGVFQRLIDVGFCTLNDIIETRNLIIKQRKNRMLGND